MACSLNMAERRELQMASSDRQCEPHISDRHTKQEYDLRWSFTIRSVSTAVNDAPAISSCCFAKLPAN